MEISPRKSSKRMLEPIDEWLQNEGYFRKHTPRDPTCLFRAISEQVYSIQRYHIRVRQECVEFMRKNKDYFQEHVNVPFDNYLEQMSYVTEWGGELEIKAISLLYKKDIIVFHGHELTRQKVSDNNFEECIYLCFTLPKQYESIYSKEFISSAAFCQSVVYRVLYKDVFKMPDIDDTVHKMLHDRSSTFKHDKFFHKKNLEMREQLTELVTKMEDESEEISSTNALMKGLTPFPYRIAKALDPCIYRNTDFDIWHETRREIRNSGQSRYNGLELQVGGRCLVLMDIKVDELDNINNNSMIISGDKDTVGNDQIAVMKTGKQDMTFNGHIQEMTKNEGPVVVFIEELGEKRTVPYAALKPVSMQKIKQSTWGLPPSKKNVFVESNQKWRRTWGSNCRKIKHAVTASDVLNDDIDRNNNNSNNGIISKSRNGNNNHITGTNKNENEENIQWEEEVRHCEDGQPTMLFETYTMEQFTSFQGFSVNTSVDVLPVTVVLDNTQQTVMEHPIQDCSEGTEKNSVSSSENPRGDNLTKTIAVNSTAVVAVENNAQSSQICTQRSSNEIQCPPTSGPMQFFSGNANMFYVSADGNLSPIQYFAGNSVESTALVTHIDRTLRSINLSAPKSVDATGSDLPFSDTITLRFFYNLGWEYFRASNMWTSVANGQAVTFGSGSMEQIGPSQTSMPSSDQGLPTNEEEVSRLSSNMRQNCSITRRKGDGSNNGAGRNSTGHRLPLKPVGQRAENVQDYSARRNEIRKGSYENNKNSYVDCDRSKDQAFSNREVRFGRNGIAPRFKKNSDGRQRGRLNHHTQHRQLQQSIRYQQNTENVEAPPQNANQNDGQKQRLNSNNNQPVGLALAGHCSPFQGPCAQQAIYPPVPYYSGETEYPNSFYGPNPPTFFPVSYIPHADIGDGNNGGQYPSQVYAGTENFTPSFAPLCPPYMYTQQNMFPPPNAQENWYPPPAQTHYVQFSPVPAPLPGPTPNP
ncbi:GATA zinc finger domain-containing protein 7 isoform X2 [Orussus abietinus]|uniref:GATA zinc finger domain-containing protein 7 isoform X2 n=1 Tax=Orussus abietinus TaxID=222816 RepID=UPI000625ECA4|nr:GATA zinc finger domain-containing protein 7 isoform X2 [Orussus abietinus]